MGGWGSGSYYRLGNSKRTTGSSLPLDIRKIKREGCLTPGRWFSWQWSTCGNVRASIGAEVLEDCLILKYTHNKTDAVEQRISFAWTPCNYGGRRVWFICPYCGKRVAVLYSGGKYFACRGCCNLTYQSCNETTMDRKYRRANNLRERIGGKPGCFDRLPIFKPKFMHQITWTRIKWEIMNIEDAGLRVLGHKLGMNGF